MKLHEIIEYLNEYQDGRDAYTVVALVRREEAPPDEEMPYDAVPIVDVEVDHSDSEINLIIEPPEHRAAGRPALSLRDFSSRLQSLLPEHRDYALVTACELPELDDEYVFRLDTPVVAIAISEEDRRMALVQWYEGIEEELGLGTDA